MQPLVAFSFAQLDLRFKLSESTYKVSVFTRGVLAMETTFVGLVAIDPKKLLEDGIRKVRTVSNFVPSFLEC